MAAVILAAATRRARTSSASGGVAAEAPWRLNRTTPPAVSTAPSTMMPTVTMRGQKSGARAATLMLDGTWTPSGMTTPSTRPKAAIRMTPRMMLLKPVCMAGQEKGRGPAPPPGFLSPTFYFTNRPSFSPSV